MKLSKEIYLSSFIGERLLAGYSFDELYSNYAKTDVLYHCAEIRSSPLRILGKEFDSAVNIGVDYGIVSHELEGKTKEISVLSFDTLQAKVLQRSGFKTITSLDSIYDFLLCLDLDALQVIEDLPKSEVLKKYLKFCNSALIGSSSNLGIKSLANADFSNLKDLSFKQYLDLFSEFGFSVKVYFPYPSHVIASEIFSEQYPIRSSGIYNSNVGLNSEVLNIVDENLLLESFHEKGISNQLTNSYLFYLERI